MSKLTASALRVAVLAVTALVLGTMAVTTAAAQQNQAPNEVQVELTEYEIRMPESLPAGPTTFAVTNVGTIEHNFEIEGQGIEREFEQNLQPGESNSMQVDLQPGEYTIYCPVGNHRAQGMELTLTVTEQAEEAAQAEAEQAEEEAEEEPAEEEAEVPENRAEGAPPVPQPGGDLPGEPAIELVKVADGLVDPVGVAAPDDGSGRLFVVERHGVVRIVQDGELLEEPFLDISDSVLAAFLEQGMYDIAFHPNFSQNGYVYVHFAELLRNGDSMIVRYTVSPDNPNQADPESAKVLMQIDQPWANHNGGELEFGPDGYLYIGSGDGGWEGDPLEAGQDLSTWLGKVLRIDVDVPENMAYAIPEDNPFAERAGLVELFNIPEEVFAQIHTEAKPEIWAYGLRNPWQFDFDRETGDLYLPDVGQNHWEEINFEPADSEGGINYGWDFLMGSHCFPIEAESCPVVGVLPVAEYSHEGGNCAVTGIGVYRGGEFAELNGIYFAGDYCSGRVWGMARTDGDTWAFQELLDTDLQITGAGTAPNGDLYVTSCQCNYGGPLPPENPPGSLWRVVATSAVPEGAETAGHEEGAPGHEEHQHGAATEEGEETAGAEAEPTDEANQVQVSLVEFAIEMPASISAGATTFEVTNDGTIEHNFEIEGQGIEEEFEQNLQPGESNSMQVDLQPGEYTIYCPVGNHRAQGMELTLTVTEQAEEAAQAEAEQAEEEAEEEGAAPTAAGDVVETLRAQGLSEFVTALQTAGLADELMEGGPFTVFAPTDEVFAALPADTLNDPEALAPVLQRHIVVDRVSVADLAELGVALTVPGDVLTIVATADGTLTVNGAAVTRGDIQASNGVIHVIDAVLSPG